MSKKKIIKELKYITLMIFIVQILKFIEKNTVTNLFFCVNFFKIFIFMNCVNFLKFDFNKKKPLVWNQYIKTNINLFLEIVSSLKASTV